MDPKPWTRKARKARPGMDPSPESPKRLVRLDGHRECEQGRTSDEQVVEQAIEQGWGFRAGGPDLRAAPAVVVEQGC